MTKTAPPTGSVTGLVPAQRHPAPEGAPEARPEAAPSGASGLRRTLAILRGLRSLRPVPAKAQESYGESDGQ